MSPYILHCTVCEHDFTRRNKWLRHLLKSEHQKKARDQFFQWEDKLKECVLVVFSSFPVAKCDAILQHFSSNRWMEDEGFVENDKLVIVTDFVWFPERPCVGFLQFESSAKIDVILPRSSSLEVRIGNQLVQLKKAGDYMQLEWNLLLTLKSQACHTNPNMAEVNDRNSVPKPVLPEDTCSEQPGSTHIAQKENDNNNEAKKDCTFESLGYQFESIRWEMAIPDHIYKDTCLVAIKLESVFSDRFPNARAILFRNDFLAMYNGSKCTGDDNVMIFLLTKSENNASGDEVNWITGDTLNTFEQVFGTPKARHLFGGRVVATDQQILCGSTFISKNPALKFNIITDPILLPEVQACRLLKYMITFDSRVRPLLTLVRFWAKINAVRISRNPEKCSEPPESAHLDWLLIFFLCNKKILPTPRQIQLNPHEPLLLDGVDIGFSEDSCYPDEWRLQNQVHDANWSDSLFHVFPLLLGFFQFLDTDVFGPGRKMIVINTRDGDIINKVDLFPKTKGTSIVPPLEQIAYLTKEEVEMVRSHKKVTNEQGSGSTLKVLHPLYLASLCELDLGGILKNTGTIIRETRKQLEARVVKCDISGKVKLIGDSRLETMLRVVGHEPN